MQLVLRCLNSPGNIQLERNTFNMFENFGIYTSLLCGVNKSAHLISMSALFKVILFSTKYLSRNFFREDLLNGSKAHCKFDVSDLVNENSGFLCSIRFIQRFDFYRETITFFKHLHQRSGCFKSG